MGFAHEKSAHHFHLLADGGVIEVTALDPRDTTTRDEIRMHLAHVARMFSDGDFSVPMFIHDRMPPGVPLMRARRNTITYVFEATPGGGRVLIISHDAGSVTAIHDFLSLQIDDHRSGDPREVTPDPGPIRPPAR